MSSPYLHRRSQRWHRLVIAATLALTPLPAVSAALSVPEGAPSVARADAAFDAGDWHEAVRRYREVVVEQPDDGRIWHRLGAALAASGDFRAAIDAFERSRTLGFAPLRNLYNVAAAQTRLGRGDEALATLEGMVENGYPNAQQLETDAAFAALRAEPRFVAAVAGARRNAAPCEHDDRYRAFDFWLGEWTVTAAGQAAGTSRVELGLGGCVLQESWSGAGGYAGRSLNLFDPGLGKWRQFWVDSQGTATEFEGVPAADGMTFTGFQWQEGGKKLLRKMTFTRLDAGRLRQLGEGSTDDGKTWFVMYAWSTRRSSRSADDARGAAPPTPPPRRAKSKSFRDL